MATLILLTQTRNVARLITPARGCPLSIKDILVRWEGPGAVQGVHFANMGEGCSSDANFRTFWCKNLGFFKNYGVSAVRTNRRERVSQCEYFADKGGEWGQYCADVFYAVSALSGHNKWTYRLIFTLSVWCWRSSRNNCCEYLLFKSFVLTRIELNPGSTDCSTRRTLHNHLIIRRLTTSLLYNVLFGFLFICCRLVGNVDESTAVGEQSSWGEGGTMNMPDCSNQNNSKCTKISPFFS